MAVRVSRCRSWSRSMDRRGRRNLGPRVIVPDEAAPLQDVEDQARVLFGRVDDRLQRELGMERRLVRVVDSREFLDLPPPGPGIETPPVPPPAGPVRADLAHPP